MKKLHKIRIIMVLSILVGCTLIDQISKFLVSKTMTLYGIKPVLGNFFQFHYITNRGFLLGLGSQLNDGTVFNGVVMITIAALLILIGYFIYLIIRPDTASFLLVIFSILLGGAMGNFLDRLIKGKVVDFFEFNLPAFHIGRTWFNSFPIFNCADFFVSTGIILLLIFYIFFDKPHHALAPVGEPIAPVSETGTTELPDSDTSEQAETNEIGQTGDASGEMKDTGPEAVDNGTKS